MEGFLNLNMKRISSNQLWREIILSQRDFQLFKSKERIWDLLSTQPLPDRDIRTDMKRKSNQVITNQILERETIERSMLQRVMIRKIDQPLSRLACTLFQVQEMLQPNQWIFILETIHDTMVLHPRDWADREVTIRVMMFITTNHTSLENQVQELIAEEID